MLHYTPQHVSSSTLLIIRRTSCITTASGIVTLCKQPYSMQVESGLQSSTMHTKLVHNSFNLQQYICYTTLLNMFRAARCSSSGVPIVCRWRADCSPLSTCVLYGCLQRVTIPEAVVIQLVLLMMSSVLLETC